MLASHHEVIGTPSARGDRPNVEPIWPDDEVEEPVLGAPSDAARVVARTPSERIELGWAAAAVDDVADALARCEALVVVVMSTEDKADVVALEERHPARDHRRVRRVGPARERRMVEGGDLPACVRWAKHLGEPRRLGRSYGVRVEDVELDRPEHTAVEPPRHLEVVELVTPSVHSYVMIAENSCDGTSPAEARLPVRVKRARALRVVVIPKRQDQVGRVSGLEATNSRPEAALGLAADAEVAESDDPHRWRGRRRAGAGQHERGEGQKRA